MFPDFSKLADIAKKFQDQAEEARQILHNLKEQLDRIESRIEKLEKRNVCYRN